MSALMMAQLPVRPYRKARARADLKFYEGF
jgi:hypothetical protein